MYSISGYIAIFIAATVILAIGTTILDQTSGSFQCGSLSGNATHGWESICLKIQEQQIQSLTIYAVIMSLGAVSVVFVLRQISG